MSPEGDVDRGLAIERTVLAWQRTGLGHMAMGALCLRLLPESPGRPVLACAMIAVGIAVSVGGRRLDPAQPHRRSLAALGIATTGAFLAAIVLSFTSSAGT